MKRKILYIVALLSLFGNYSCNKEKTELKFSSIQDITCISMDYPEILGITMQILKIDGLLLINDYQGDTLIHVYDIANKQFIRKLIPVGRGPGELISPLQIHRSKDNLLIYSRRLFELYSIPVTKIMDGNNNMLKKFKLSTAEANRLFPLNDSIFISSGYFSKRYALIDNKGEKISEFEEYPDFYHAEKDFPIFARGMFHQCSFVKHPKDNRLIAYTPHVLDILDYDDADDRPVLKKRIPFSSYNYSYIDSKNGSSVSAGSDVETGIVGVDCTSKYIYVVYSPNKKEEKSSITQIKIIDWEGKPIKQLNYSKKITCFYIDEENSKGYVIARDPDDTLMYFNLEI